MGQPLPSMCPVVVWEVEREVVVVVMFGSGGVATGLTAAASWTSSTQLLVCDMFQFCSMLHLLR